MTVLATTTLVALDRCSVDNGGSPLQSKRLFDNAVETGVKRLVDFTDSSEYVLLEKLRSIQSV